MLNPETFEFQTEARELLDLMIHSVYSNKDIFLRELISNSSDALDKLRIESLRNEGIQMPPEAEIRIEIDRAERTLSVIDNGIGMSHDEIIQNIGTIAKSGTREFIKAMKSGESAGGANAELIGQFGVGFYSTFMVADRVTMLTRRAGEESAWLWESTGDGTYSLTESHRPIAGTTVTLHLKPSDAENALNDYTQEWTIRSIVKKYSDFVTYPVKMRVERQEAVRDEEGKIKEGEYTTVVGDETLNSMKALWRRPKESVTTEEYAEFYKHISHDWTEPLETIYLRAEGAFEYHALLFIPSKAPFDLFMQEGSRGLHLYVKRVFIMDDAEELMPTYLRFMRGVVDSEDLPLNVSREILQQNRQITMIRKRLTKKVLDTLGEMRSADKAKYLVFWSEFGRVLKEGLMNDQENRDQILSLSMFNSTAGEELTSLGEYVQRMKSDQSEIYYISGEARSVLEKSPHLEAFRSRGYEVLLLSDPVDEVWAPGMEFEGKKLVSVARANVEVGSEEERKAAEEKRKEGEREYGAMLAALQERLKEQVSEIKLSTRLTESAAVLVHEENAMSPQLEKIFRQMGQPVPESKRILELNPSHPVLAKLLSIYSADPSNPRFTEYGELLYGQALLAEGSQLPDPARFSKLVADLMAG